jgi:DNA ligase-1
MKTFPTLYHRSAKNAVQQWTISSDGPVVTTIWGQQNGQLQTSTQTVAGKNIGRSNETSAEEQAEKEAQSQWEKKLRLKYSTSLEEADSDEELSPMLAQDFNKRKAKLDYSEGVAVQIKYDGLRALAVYKNGKVVLQSRGNKTYLMPHIEAALEPILSNNPGLVLDGELYNHDLDLQTLNSLIRKRRPESHVVQYHVYDVIEDGCFSSRLQTLNSLKAKFSDNGPLRVAPTCEAFSEQDVINLQAAFIAEGYEGAMVRTLTGQYRVGYRSPDLLKVKSWLDSEFVVVNWTTGKGKFENVPIFTCVTPEGKEFNVSPTGTQEQRAQMLKEATSYIGKKMKVKYFALSPSDLVPLYPIGLGLRFPEDM